MRLAILKPRQGMEAVGSEITHVLLRIIGASFFCFVSYLGEVISWDSLQCRFKPFSADIFKFFLDLLVKLNTIFEINSHLSYIYALPQTKDKVSFTTFRVLLQNSCVSKFISSHFFCRERKTKLSFFLSISRRFLQSYCKL